MTDSCSVLKSHRRSFAELNRFCSVGLSFSADATGGETQPESCRKQEAEGETRASGWPGSGNTSSRSTSADWEMQSPHSNTHLSGHMTENHLRYDAGSSAAPQPTLDQFSCDTMRRAAAVGWMMRARWFLLDSRLLCGLWDISALT